MSTDLKSFVLKIEILETNMPQNWTFKNVSGVEQLAIWTIVKTLAERQLALMIDGNFPKLGAN